MRVLAWFLSLILGVGLGLGLGHALFTPATTAESKTKAQATGEPVQAGNDKRTARNERQSLRGRAVERQTLEALPYVDGTFDPESARGGVLAHVREKVAPGLNFYCSRDLKSAILLDPDGKVVRRWQFPTRGLDHCELLPNGHVIGLIQDRELIEVDLAAKTVWRLEAEVHHSFFRTENGDLYVLARRPRRVPELHARLPVYEDLVLVLDASGRKKGEISLFEALWRSPFRFLFPAVGDHEDAKDRQEVLDLLHANHVEVLDGRLASRSPLFERGNLLVSFRNISTVAILDPAGHKVLWVWGPSNLAYQHQPSLLDNGHLLIFNNGSQTSEVLEVDPASQRIVWRYEDGKNFFSATRGSCQRLPNGNTLITESNKGYVFEVTPAGEKVWVWANPLILEGQKRAFVWRMNRYPLDRLPFLAAP